MTRRQLPVNLYAIVRIVCSDSALPSVSRVLGRNGFKFYRRGNTILLELGMDDLRRFVRILRRFAQEGTDLSVSGGDLEIEEIAI